MKIGDAFPSNYLKADEFVDNDTTVVIESIATESIGQGKDASDKLVLYFRGQDKGLVLNKTNANTIAGLYGDETDGWIGKPVILYATEVDFQGKQVLAIRVRMRKPGAKPAGGQNKPAPARQPTQEEEIAAYSSGGGDQEIPDFK